ncbi:MAG: DUF3796 domain-containing protein [Promethearchaeota archaeon]
MRRDYLGYLGFLGLLGLLYIPSGNFGFFGFFGFFGCFAIFRAPKGATTDERLAHNWCKAARNGFIIVTLLASILLVLAYFTGSLINPLSILVIILTGGYTLFGASLILYDQRGD